ncbi:MAG: YbaB/EbfC family nucleoid-associated protein [Candidatus Falkowbacteria bacterium]
MSMFNKLKQIKDLRGQAKTMQNALAEVIITEEHHGVSITMNGNMEVQKITIADSAKEHLEENIKQAINNTIKKAQMAMAKKMQEMGNMPGLSDLLK